MIVKYSKKFPYAPFLNEDIGFEMSIPDNSNRADMLVALSTLKEIAEKFHKDNNPQLGMDDVHTFGMGGVQMQVPINQPIQSVDYKAKERLEILIDNAESLFELEKYKDESEKLGLARHYGTKHLQFIHGKPIN
jgi:hypothetical protein